MMTIAKVAHACCNVCTASKILKTILRSLTAFNHISTIRAGTVPPNDTIHSVVGRCVLDSYMWYTLQLSNSQIDAD